MMETEAQQRSAWPGTSWWRALYKGYHGYLEPVKSTGVVGPLTHDIMSLMSELLMLWNCLNDAEIMRLRKVVLNSDGIRMLVSDEDDVLLEIVLSELIQNWVYVAKYVCRLGKKCEDPVSRRLDEFLNDPDGNDLACYEWEFRLPKMERKVKKMEKLIGASMQLNQELEVLAEMEQTCRRMRVSGTKKARLLEFQNKVVWQRQKVKDVRDKSLWNRTYDYIVRLMARSLFTILNRLKDTFGASENESNQHNLAGLLNYDLTLHRSQSFSAAVHSVGYPTENDIRGVSTLVPEHVEGKTIGKAHHRSSFSFSGMNIPARSKRQVHAGPFKECTLSDFASSSPSTWKLALGGSVRSNSYRLKKTELGIISNKHSRACKTQIHSKIHVHSPKWDHSAYPQNTLGDTGLALHFANVIILTHKLASSPHLISHDARNDLYKKLPASVKSALRVQLQPCAKTLANCIYDAQLSTQWKSAVTLTLRWLAPLAYDTIRWQSEHSLERQQSSSRTKALLVQTLHYANQRKTEAAITQVLMGLNYLSRFAMQVESKKQTDSIST